MTNQVIADHRRRKVLKTGVWKGAGKGCICGWGGGGKVQNIRGEAKFSLAAN